MDRLNSESCPLSQALADLSMMADAWWNRFHLASDDWGVFPANAKILKGKLWPLRDDMRLDKIKSLLNEYAKHDLVFLWVHEGKEFGYFIGWFEHQPIKYLSRRKYPAPPKENFEFTHPKMGPGLKRFGSKEVIIKRLSGQCPDNDRTLSSSTGTGTGTGTGTDKDLRLVQAKPGDGEIHFQGSILKIPLKSHEAFVKAFPSLPIEAEYKKMDAWLIANPKKDKKNHPRFALNWLSRSEKEKPATPAKKKFELPTLQPRD